MPDDDAVTLRSADVVAFVGELILLGVLAVAGFRLGYGILAVVLAIALPTLMGVLWGRWLAPQALRRMHHPQRLVTKLGVAATAAVLLGLTGLPLWSLFFLVTVGTVFAVTGVGRAANPTRSPSDTA